MSEAEPVLTQTHHALLFAWLARGAVDLVGEARGEAAMRLAVRRYGQERGRRMAARCRANGHALTMLNFFAYGEWQVEQGQMVSSRTRQGADVQVLTYQCPWHSAWTTHQLLPYGRFYCLEIDEAVLAGFSPALSMEVNGTLSNGAPHCEFVFHKANMNLANLLLLWYRRTVHPRDSAVMPWPYHTGHLYSTMARVLVDELGTMGKAAAASAMAAFADRFGEEAAQAIQAYQGTDFSTVPGLGAA
jgi:hypothetical protein